MTHKLLFASLLLSGFAQAGLITYTTTGTFDEFTPVTSLTAPSTLFSLTFTVSDTPVPDSFNLGHVSNVSVPATFVFGANTVNFASTPIEFYNSVGGGGYDVYYTNGINTLYLNFFGPQMYSGTEDNPTMLAISFTATASNYSIDGSAGQFADSPSIVASTVPEPGSAAACVAGLLALLLLRRFRTAAK